MLCFGLYFSWYILVIKNAGTDFLFQFIYVYLSLIIIAEGLIAFLRTRDLLNRSKSDCKKKLNFNLLVLPYLPAFVGTVLYSIIGIIEYGILYKGISKNSLKANFSRLRRVVTRCSIASYNIAFSKLPLKTAVFRGSHKREFLITLGITLPINFFFSVLYNIRIKLLCRL